MNKSFNEIVEEVYNNLSVEELWDFILDSKNYLIKNANVVETGTKEEKDYFIMCVNIIHRCLKTKKISFKQFKAVNKLTKAVMINHKVEYRELN